MKIHIVSSNESDLLRNGIGGLAEELFPDGVRDEPVRLIADQSRCCPYSALVIPERLEWAANGRNDIHESVSIAYLNAMSLRATYGAVDHLFARVYVGMSLVVRVPETGLDVALCPKNADEMFSCIGTVPIDRCRFVFSVCTDNPYLLVAEPVMCMTGDVYLSETEENDWDGDLVPVSGRDPIGAFLSRVNWGDSVLIRERDGFRKTLRKRLRKLFEPSFWSEFN